MSLVPMVARSGSRTSSPMRAMPVTRHCGSRPSIALTPRSANLAGPAGSGRGGGSSGSRSTGQLNGLNSRGAGRISGSPGEASVAPHGLDVSTLLAALQRGSVPGGDANVKYLCQKFTALLERLQRAEAGERESEERCAALQSEIQTLSNEEQLERSELSTTETSLREDLRKLEDGIAEAQREEATAQEELKRTQAETDAFVQRRKALDEQCASERSRLAEVNSQLRRMQITRPCGRTELRRLQEHLHELTGQYNTAAEDLERQRERGAREEARLTELKAEAASHDEAHARSCDVSAKKREELNETLRELALLKERCTEAQVGVQRCEDELQRRAERKSALQCELHRYETWLGNARRQIEGLREVEQGLARVQGDTTEVRTVIGIEEAEAQNGEANKQAQETTLTEAEKQLHEKTLELEEVERERCTLHSEISKAEDEQAALEAQIEQLRHDQAASGGMRQNLENETHMLLTEAEKLRRERDERLAERTENQQRLQLVTPALVDARRRVRELEDSLEASRAEAAREQQLSERLERETGICQDKMRALREQNVKLAEQCTTLEAELAHTSARVRSASASSRSLRAPGPKGGTCGPPRTRSLSRSGLTGSHSTPGQQGRGFVGCYFDEEDMEGVEDSPRMRSLPTWQAVTPSRVSARELADGDCEGTAAVPGAPYAGGWTNDLPAPLPMAASEGLEGIGPEISDGLMASAGAVPRDAALPQQNYGFLRQWIQSEEERLSGSGHHL